MAAEYKAQLLVVEAKLEREPDNEELQNLKENLLELIEISEDLGLEEEKEEEEEKKKAKKVEYNNSRNSNNNSKSSCDVDQQSRKNNATGSGFREPPTEAELLAKKKEKNRKKKAKLREKIKEQLDIAESEKQSWQSFANKKGLKGVTKRSIFASPCSVTGKVGVGTNGIADAPAAVLKSALASASSATTTTHPKSLLCNRKRRH